MRGVDTVGERNAGELRGVLDSGALTLGGFCPAIFYRIAGAKERGTAIPAALDTLGSSTVVLS